jgi:predicted acylesterase/phospholipase RssA
MRLFRFDLRNLNGRSHCSDARATQNGTNDYCSSNSQSVDDTILKYKTLSQKVFSSKSTDPKATFNHKVLEQEIKNVIATAVAGGQSESTQLEDPRVDLCRTFVVSTSLHAGGAVRMRSFGTRDADPFPACIWQVARATSAAPTYFLPMEIDDVLYGDGGTGWNNPTKEAIEEARTLWPSRPIGILVSIGTGLEEALQLNDTSKELPKVVESLLRNTSPGHAFKLAVAEYAVKCITSCELIHREVAERCNREILEGNYFRLNVPQGMSSIGLAEWEKLGAMIALTNRYMDHGDKRKEKRRIAELLRDPDRAG